MPFIIADNYVGPSRCPKSHDEEIAISNDRWLDSNVALHKDNINVMDFRASAKSWQRHLRGSRESATKIEPLTATASLMNLPTELRVQVFEYVFDNRRPITLFHGSNIIVLVNSSGEENIDGKAGNKPTALLRVCRQIYTEAIDVFFNRTLFGIIASPYEQPVSRLMDRRILKTINFCGCTSQTKTSPSFS